MTRTNARARGGPNIIGISAGYHDSACCLLSGGALVAAAQEERFSRVKNDKSMPRKAFRFCLQRGGLSIADIDCVAFYEDSQLKLERQIWMALQPGVSDARRTAILRRMAARRPEDEIRHTLGYSGRFHSVDHHASHAASAFFFSGFHEAAVLTVDAVGDWPTTTYSRANGTSLDRFEEVRFPHSLGLLYSALTGYLGFEVNEGEYKVMGLAPYGEPRYRDRIERLIENSPKGQFQLDMKYFDFLRRDCMYSEDLVQLLGEPARSPGSALTQFHSDVARSVQVVLEDVLLQKVRYLHDQTRMDHLCMAGGVALNVVANSRCLREGPFSRLFVQPAAGDAGGALGAAALAHIAMTQECPSPELRGMFLGPANEGALALLQGSSAKFRDFTGAEDALLEAAVDHLVAGHIVAWSQGPMEFGPRALGARSILADPRVPDMRDRINAVIKQRESFRPFAPAVLEHFACEHFELDHPSPYMLEVCKVVSKLDLPAITHVDGSARAQTVNAATNPRFARLLAAFHRRTGCPILLNTSFNMQGEPIVCSPMDALMCFVRSNADVLVLEDCLMERAGIPLLWEIEAATGRARRRSDQAVDHLVYTLV